MFDSEQDKLKTERRAAEQLRTTATAQLDDVQEALDLALSRVERPQEVYRDGTPLERRLMNRAIFERIEVGDDGEITGTKLTPVYKALSAWQPSLGQPKAAKDKGARAQNRPTQARVRPLFAPVHFLRSATSADRSGQHWTTAGKPTVVVHYRTRSRGNHEVAS
ncbi:MAG: hypothetical protein ACRDJ3_00895 [Solirubrobacteraceae bacterium]